MITNMLISFLILSDEESKHSPGPDAEEDETKDTFEDTFTGDEPSSNIGNHQRRRNSVIEDIKQGVPRAMTMLNFL